MIRITMSDKIAGQQINVCILLHLSDGQVQDLLSGFGRNINIDGAVVLYVVTTNPLIQDNYQTYITMYLHTSVTDQQRHFHCLDRICRQLHNPRSSLNSQRGDWISHTGKRDMLPTKIYGDIYNHKSTHPYTVVVRKLPLARKLLVVDQLLSCFVLYGLEHMPLSYPPLEPASPLSDLGTLLYLRTLASNAPERIVDGLPPRANTSDLGPPCSVSPTTIFNLQGKPPRPISKTPSRYSVSPWTFVASYINSPFNLTSGKYTRVFIFIFSSFLFSFLFPVLNGFHPPPTSVCPLPPTAFLLFSSSPNLRPARFPLPSPRLKTSRSNHTPSSPPRRLLKVDKLLPRLLSRA
ncbi:hypothetical protein ACRALDRAFT_209513 [Sodiomyces alcalophilus JCM 7366]|uniref:uncharacterized protein n=1 Tax=Sodiomyces alcalophilus JCM 7366 TaxID=591952 RepID=UPI0039B558CF